MDDWESDFKRFRKLLKNRMYIGEIEYGDSSFDRHPVEIVKEIQEELLDVCNWSFIMWRRMEKLVV